MRHTHTHTRLMALFPGLPGWASTRKVKPIWILLKQETVSGSGISWAICKSAPRYRHITTPAPHQSVFYRPDALHAAQPTASKHWRHSHSMRLCICNDTVSVHLSVCLAHLVPQRWHAAGLLLWAQSACSIDRLLHGASAAGAVVFRSRSAAARWSAANATESSINSRAMQEADHRLFVK